MQSTKIRDYLRRTFPQASWVRFRWFWHLSIYQYLHELMGCGHQIWTAGTAFKEESIGYSFSGASVVIITYSRDFEKSPYL